VNKNVGAAELSPVLVLAFPEALRAGLPVIVTRTSAHGPGSGRTYDAVWLGELDGERFVARVCALDNGIFSPGMEQLGDEAIVQLDLRDSTVRDAIVRSIWRRLRPEEAEPLTAGRFWKSWVEDVRRWFVERECDSNTESVEFRTVGRTREGEVFVVTALAFIPLDSPDRDLLALAEVSKAVMS
jgi:hypothetical protein